MMGLKLNYVYKGGYWYGLTGKCVSQALGLLTHTVTSTIVYVNRRLLEHLWVIAF